MLVLTRKRKEAVIVPDCGVMVTVLEIRGGQVRLGISAPPNVRVHRREVWDRLQPWVDVHETALPGGLNMLEYGDQ
jgi:carbon storage regulator